MEFAQDWVVKKLIFHWLCKPCNCDSYQNSKCARCGELPLMVEAFPEQHAYAVYVYNKYLTEYNKTGAWNGIQS
jgi:hypothetical protein